MLDFLTVVDKEDIWKGVDYKRNAVRRDEMLKKDDENVRQISWWLFIFGYRNAWGKCTITTQWRLEDRNVNFNFDIYALFQHTAILFIHWATMFCVNRVHRTNNVIESYNHDFNKIFPCVHLFLFNFCDYLHSEANQWSNWHEIQKRHFCWKTGKLVSKKENINKMNGQAVCNVYVHFCLQTIAFVVLFTWHNLL